MNRIALSFFTILFVLSSPAAQSQPMPDILDIDYLLSLPKYRNIHHDSFCRADNETEIGNNALPGRKNVLGYRTMTEGEAKVGIKNNCATNFQKSVREGRCIKYIDVGRTDYHITAVRKKENGTDERVAFYIKDINNFYYATLSEKKYVVFRYVNGKRKTVSRGKRGGVRLEVSVDGKKAQILVDGKTVKRFKLSGWTCEDQLCGLLFENNTVSCVDDFVVDYQDRYKDVGIDEAVEREELLNPSFGTYCAEDGVCTSSSRYVKRGAFSYRFQLKKPTQKQVDANRNNAIHSTLMLNKDLNKGDYAIGHKMHADNKPLDSFILSTDILFPGAGDEEWKLDEFVQELIIQEHHVGYGIPFSPSLSINIKQGDCF